MNRTRLEPVVTTVHLSGSQPELFATEIQAAFTSLRQPGKAGRRAAGATLARYLRSDLKLARISSEKSCGCSQAAKWPPLSSRL